MRGTSAFKLDDRRATALGLAVPPATDRSELGIQRLKTVADQWLVCSYQPMSDNPPSHDEVLKAVAHGREPQPSPEQVFEALVWAGEAAPDMIREWLNAGGIVQAYH